VQDEFQFVLNSGDFLEILLDNGEPIENVPGSIKAEGHDVLGIKQIEEYWQVSIRKG
jgi:sulfite reductase (ferredoxin)